ncbi:MAG: EF-P lysine aminoacylase GenX [Candidatus Magasanikbacteria bacterium]|nr:EF-P lysine aminoacylase GenX [Candidatus Magasanikbacteria bacterium]
MVSWRELRDNPRARQLLEQRWLILRLVREWFWSRNFAEVQTPLAVRHAGQEPYLNPVSLTLQDAAGAPYPLQLHTSPEYSLKKLLAAGFPRIFEITKTFRDGEDIRGLHHPEFTLLEWYRAPGTLAELMDDTEGLFKAIGEKLGAPTVGISGESTSVKGAWKKKTMRALWQEWLDADLNNLLTREALAEFARARGYAVTAGDAYEDIFFKIFLDKIEPRLGREAPLFVYDYPSQMASLSRLSPRDPRYAERFELYIGGVEIANAFGELLDAEEQLRRLEADQAHRQKLGKPTWAVDQDFIAALRSGIPAPAAGIALGIDRMVLLFTGARGIEEVIFHTLGDQWEQQN